MNLTLILSTALPLFLIMDPVGNTPVLLALLKDFDTKKQRRIMIRELLIALIFIVSFYFIGEIVLGFLNIAQPTIRIAGGIILFIISIKMIFPQIEKNNSEIQAPDPFIVPIAIPLIAGPSLIATVSLYSHQINNHAILLSSIILAWTGVTIILMCAPFLKKILGDRGLIACERMMGLLLILISVQMLLDGISIFAAGFAA